MKLGRGGGLSSILSPFHNEIDKFDNTRARMLDSIKQMIPNITFKTR